MGDRANIVVKEGDDQVCLYTHWRGSELPDILLTAMKRAKDRITDYQYLTRIIFCEMVKGHEMELTGYGITSKVGGGENRIITVDVDNKTVKIGIKGVPIDFEDLVSCDTAGW